jgi:hypothetical protein
MKEDPAWEQQIAEARRQILPTDQRRQVEHEVASLRLKIAALQPVYAFAHQRWQEAIQAGASDAEQEPVYAAFKVVEDVLESWQAEEADLQRQLADDAVTRLAWSARVRRFEQVHGRAPENLLELAQWQDI